MADRIERALDHPRRRPVGPFARLALIAVRVGEVPGQEVAIRDRLRRNVCVKIEGRGDRHVPADARPKLSKQRRLGVGQRRGDHAAVERQDDRVEVPAPRGLDHPVADFRKDSVLDGPARLSAKHGRHDDLDRSLRRGVNDPAQSGIRPQRLRDRGLAVRNLEVGPHGADRVEAVGFLLNTP